VVEELRTRLDSFGWPSMFADVKAINGQYFLILHGLPNRRREEAEAVDDLLRFVASHLPGSYGLLYERDDSMPVPPGPGAFRVRVLARGNVAVRLDPFLSPCQPVIDD